MKKRRAKTPLFLLLVLLAGGGFFGYRYVYESQGEMESMPVAIKTWSGFSDRKRLDMLLQGFAISSVADIPCSGMDYLDLSALPVHRYLGIVSERGEAASLQIQYGSEKASFIALNPIIDVLPRVDLILCWDALCALSSLEIRSALMQFKKSGASFILMRHFPELTCNEEMESGVYQPVNWRRSPYNFPEPIIHIMEKGEHGMESLALWNLADLPS